MTPKNELERITLDTNIMAGKPTIRDTRVTVGTILGLLASGCSSEEILKEYPYLEAEDIRQSLSYAAWRISEESDVPLRTV
jgi:uncharacterized protein (DUF433 family)